MPETAITNQLPPRATTSHQWPRKWSTLGGRDELPSTINDANLIDNSSKTNGHHRQSSSLFRKSSTISRTNDPPIISDENSSSLKKSRSLMNVLRSKLNSPAVLRRFRSKSRESAKQVVATEPNSQTSNDQLEIRRKKSLSVPKSNDENNNEPRKSRKREPSPMRRLANRIAQLTTSNETKSRHRKSKSPSKSVTIDSHEETRPTPSRLHNKDEVEHLNACYDEILAKLYDNPPTKRSIASTIQPSNDYSDRSNFNNVDSQNRSLSTISINGSLLSNDYLNQSQRIHLPADPLLQARKQSNIKLNCMLSGYGFTKSFVNHEKLFGENDLFKFHHYHDVGTRKYDWNFTNNNNRILTNMKTRPMSKSIDSFRRTNTNENVVPVILERINIGDKDSTDYPSVELESHLLNADDDAPIILPYDNELFIREDSDLIESKEKTSFNQQQYPIPDVPVNIKTSISLSSTKSDENKRNSNEQTSEEQDEEFERNFLRAVDRALGIANKDQNNSIQSGDDISTKTDQSNLNLIQMTERALSSMNHSALFTNDDQKNEQIDNEHLINDTGSSGVDLLDRTDKHLVNDTELSSAELFDSTNEHPIHDTKLSSAKLLGSTDKHLINDTKIPTAELLHSTNEPLINDTESPSAELLDRTDEHPINDTVSPSAALADRTDEHHINDAEFSYAELVGRTDEHLINNTELSSAALVDRTDEPLINDTESPSPELLHSTNEHPTNDTELSSAELLHSTNAHSINDTVSPSAALVDRTDEHHINDAEFSYAELVGRTDEHLTNDTGLSSAALVDRTDEPLINDTESPSPELLHSTNEHPTNDTELSSAELLHSTNAHSINDTVSPSAALADRTDEHHINDAEFSYAELVGRTDEHLINNTELSSAALVDRTDEPLINDTESPSPELLHSTNEHPTNDTELSSAELLDRTDEHPINDAEFSYAELVGHTDEHLTNDTELSSAALVDRTNEPLINDTGSPSAELLDRTDEHPINDKELSSAGLLHSTNAHSINDTVSPSAALVDRTDEHHINDAEFSYAELVGRTDEHLTNDTGLSSAASVDRTDEHLINDTELSSAVLVDRTDEHLLNDTESPSAALVGRADEHLINDSESSSAKLLDRTDEHFDIDQSSIIYNNETVNENQEEKKEIIIDDSIDENVKPVLDDLTRKIEELLVEDPKNGQAFLNKLDDEEKTIKSKADSYNKVLQSDDNRLTEDVCTDINAVIGEVNLLLRGKLKQFRGLCQANVNKSMTASGEPIPLDSDLEGFWDITYPLIDKVKEKFAKLDARKSKQWAPIEEYDPNDVNNRPRVIDNRLKQLQPQQNKSSKIPITKSTNDDLKKLIQERRKAAANTTNQNHDIEIFIAPK